MQPIIQLPELVDGPVSPEVSSGCASVHLRQYFLHLAEGDDYLCRLFIDRLPVTFQHVASHCEGFSLGPIALVDGSPVTDIPPLWGLSSLHFLH